VGRKRGGLGVLKKIREFKVGQKKKERGTNSTKLPKNGIRNAVKLEGTSQWDQDRNFGTESGSGSSQEEILKKGRGTSYAGLGDLDIRESLKKTLKSSKSNEDSFTIEKNKWTPSSRKEVCRTAT